MKGPYPRWRFFPAFTRPPPWVKPLADVFATKRAQIDSFVTHPTGMESDAVLRVVAEDLENEFGFTVERGKKKLGKLPRPVFFRDEGTYGSPSGRASATAKADATYGIPKARRG